MARARDDQPLAASVFDRLLDDDPDASRETETARVQTISQLRASVCRDVENLLNTRWRCESWPDDFTELERSVVGYGIPDVNGADLRSQSERTRFFRAVEFAVSTYEPRLQNVRVRTSDIGRTNAFVVF
jgi:type VI secretion system protein ImpF